MDFKTIVSTMTPEIRDRFSYAVEIGRWADGTKVTDEQRATCMRAVIAWDASFAEETDEPFKVQKGGKLITSASKPKAKAAIADSKTDATSDKLIKSITIEN